MLEPVGRGAGRLDRQAGLARTPRAETERLAELLTRIETLPETREFYERIGAETMRGGPQEMRAFQGAEIELWKRIATEARVPRQ